MRVKPQTIKSSFRAVLFACLIASPISWSAEQYRDFSDVQGRTIKGEVVAYDAVNNSVTIHRADDKTATVPISVFSEQDQKYILEWGIENDFMHGLSISAKLQSNKVSSEAASGSSAVQNGVDEGYDILIENKTRSNYGSVTVEYCIFYRKGKRNGSRVTYNEGVLYGKSDAKELNPNSSITVKTNTIRLQSEGGGQSVFGQDDAPVDDVRGIWLRLRTTLPSAGEIVREYRTSQDSDWKWTKYSINPNSFMPDIPALSF